jgi:histidine triad (HIT) family protein
MNGILVKRTNYKLMDGCVFCKIIKGEVKKTFEYEDDDCVVFKSNAPVAEHHLLIVPKKHIENFMHLDEVITSMTKAAHKMVEKFKLGDGYKMVFNGGKYQVVMHVHWHLLAGNLEKNSDILNKL